MVNLGFPNKETHLRQRMDFINPCVGRILWARKEKRGGGGGYIREDAHLSF